MSRGAPVKALAIVRALMDPATGGITGAARAVDSHYAYAYKVASNPRWCAGPLDPVERARIRMSLEPARVLAARYDVTVAYINALRVGVEWDRLLEHASVSGTAMARSMFTNTGRPGMNA